MPRVLVDHAHRHPVAGIGARIAVEAVDLLFLAEVIDHPSLQLVKRLRLDGLVDRAPVDGVFAFAVFDEKPVLGRAPRVLPRPDRKGPRGDQDPFSPGDRPLYQSGHREAAPQNSLPETVLIQAQIQTLTHRQPSLPATRLLSSKSWAFPENFSHGLPSSFI